MLRIGHVLVDSTRGLKKMLCSSRKASVLISQESQNSNSPRNCCRVSNPQLEPLPNQNVRTAASLTSRPRVRMSQRIVMACNIIFRQAETLAHSTHPQSTDWGMQIAGVWFRCLTEGRRLGGWSKEERLVWWYEFAVRRGALAVSWRVLAQNCLPPQRKKPFAWQRQQMLCRPS